MTLTLPGSMSAELEGLCREIDLASELARDPEKPSASAPVVSAWSVRDHLEHLMRVDSGILEWLSGASRGSVADEGGRPTMVGRLILLTGVIPRGRAQAPQRVRPEGLAAHELVDGFSRLRDRARALEGRLDDLRRATARRRHPALGSMNAYQWLRFVHIHHRHHRRIVTDILSRR